MSDINTEVIQEMIMVAKNKSRINPYSTLKLHASQNTVQTTDDEPDQDWSKPLRPKREIIPEAWQNQIVKNINDRYDQFVNVSPAGGKSRPIHTQFWKDMVGKATTRDQLPRILWVCENKTLASEVRNSFIEIILDVLSESPVDGGYLERLVPHHLKFNVGNQERQFMPTNQTISELRRFAQSLTTLRMQSSNETVNQNTIAVSCTYKYAPEFIKDLQPRIVVIDEIQERFTVTSGSAKNVVGKLEQLDDRVKYLIKTFEALPSPNQCNVILLTGSMAHGTSEGIKNYLDSKYKRRFKSVSTESAVNRAAVTVLPYDDLTRKDGTRDDRAIIKEVTNQIRTGQKFNLIAIFSQKSIKNICNDVIRSTPERSPEATVGMPRNINIRQPGAMPGANYQQPIDRKVLAKLAQKMESDPQLLLNHLNSMIRGDKVGGVRTDRNLAKALQHGIGYIMAEAREGSRITRAYNPMDIKLVEILLKKGLINTVLATTSVGVGVNLKIKNLYLPSINLPNGNEMGPMDASTLVQLINRAGRQSNMAATIYCNSLALPRVIQYFGKGKYAGDPSQSVPVIPFSNSSGSLYGSDIKSRFNRSLNPTATMRLILQMLG